MPYALCPMPYAQSYLIFLRKAIDIEHYRHLSQLSKVISAAPRRLNFYAAVKHSLSVLLGGKKTLSRLSYCGRSSSVSTMFCFMAKPLRIMSRISDTSASRLLA